MCVPELYYTSGMGWAWHVSGVTRMAWLQPSIVQTRAIPAAQTAGLSELEGVWYGANGRHKAARRPRQLPTATSSHVLLFRSGARLREPVSTQRVSGSCSWRSCQRLESPPASLGARVARVQARPRAGLGQQSHATEHSVPGLPHKAGLSL